MRYFSFNSAVKRWQSTTLVEASNGLAPVGMLAPFAGATAPTGWLLCAGQTVPRLGTYANLFSVISTTYNTGGEAGTDFRLPDLRGRAIAGKDNMGGITASRITAAISGVTATNLGAAGGSERLHQHSHPNTVSGSFASSTHNHSATDAGGDMRAAIGASGNDANTIAYVATGPAFGPGSVQSYTVFGGGWTTENRGFNHYTPVYGYTSGPSGATSPGISNASNAETGTSQNLPPTMIMNYIIKV